VDGVAITVRMNEYAGRDANPNVPWTPEEIATDAAACVEAGAAVVHFHGRRPGTGAPDPSPESLGRTVELVGEACDAVTYCTLGAGTGAERNVRLGPLEAATRPELAPVDLGSFNLDPYDREAHAFATEEGLYVNTVATVRHLLTGIVAAGVAPTAVAWSIGSLRLLDALLDQGAWPRPVWGDLVVSNRILVTNPATPAGLEALVRFLPEASAHWSLMCAGESILPMVGPAVEAGLGLAFGLGDSPYPELGTPTNAEVVAAVVDELERLGRRPATPAEVRAQLGG
jgi:3-keto-5-aminohexanoate cleavage enzyme